MGRLLISVAALLVGSSFVQAQSITVPIDSVVPGESVNVTISGAPGQNFALIGSTTDSGFTYAGVPLRAGPDVQILMVGALDGAGNAVVPVRPPFPARDRYYLQAAVSPTPAFSSITPGNSLVLVNRQVARLLMPVGGIVNSEGVGFMTPGVTITRNGTVYTINTQGLFPIGAAIPTITPFAGARVMNISTNANTTTVTLDIEAGFTFLIHVIRH